jgi:hypothetical protein
MQGIYSDLLHPFFATTSCSKDERYKRLRRLSPAYPVILIVFSRGRNQHEERVGKLFSKRALPLMKQNRGMAGTESH